MKKKDFNNDGVINLRKEEEPEFKIGHIEEQEDESLVGEVKSANVTELEQTALAPQDKVKVKFDKFVNLVITHAYEDVFEKHVDEDVIISTDLLTDLANAHNEEEPKSDKKIPLFLIIGIVIGIVLTVVIFKM